MLQQLPHYLRLQRQCFPLGGLRDQNQQGTREMFLKSSRLPSRLDLRSLMA